MTDGQKDWKPKDQPERDRAIFELDRSLCVEASAGTGKTTLLVNSILERVRKGARLERTAAITFTEKAAGELKVKLREMIEERYAQSDEPERQVWQRARRELDRAHISTIHAFAAGILRMRPVEAEVDPEFEMMDELASQMLLEQAWEEWTALEMEKESRPLRHALMMGLSLKKIRELAEKLYENRDLIPEEISEPAFPDSEELFSRVRQEIDSLAELAEKHCIDRSDAGYIFISRTRNMVQDRAGMSPERREAYLFNDISLKQKGRKDNWEPKDTCTQQKERMKALEQEVEAYREKTGQALAVELMGWLTEFIGFAEKKKKDTSSLDFQDLLIKSRNLLRDNKRVRKYFQDRFENILVDEFQDTDPLQAELLFFLAEDGTKADLWKDVKIKPGKLFIVGDPKQSIYGFRRADLEVYEEVKKILGTSTVRISQNFRSAQSIIKWVNEGFSKIIQPREGFQPEYEPLFHHPEFKDALGHSSVMIIPPSKSPEEMKTTKASDIREMEAGAIAGLIQKAISEQWPVREKVNPSRAIHYGDIAILFPKRTEIQFYKEALDQHRIPFQVEGGKQFFERDEVRALRACLKAMDDPEDQLALVAALRSFFFGVTDEELFRYKSDGGEWNFLTGKRPSIQSIAQAFELLKEFHHKRTSRSFVLTIEDLLHRTYHRHLRLLRPGGQQAILNMEKVMAKARAFEAQGITSFHRFAGWLEDMELEDREESEMPQAEAEDRIVSMLTIHKAKGLEFPLVILANLATGRGGRPGVKTVIERMQNRMEFQLDPRIATPGYDGDAKEREESKREAEERRMFYVACTRARDYLVVPCFAKTPGAGAYAILSDALPEVDNINPGDETKGMFVIDADDLPEAPPEDKPFQWQKARKKDEQAVERMKAEKGDWIKGHEQAKQRAMQGISIIRPSKMAEDEGHELTRDYEKLLPRDTALNIGIAVHQVMELLDPAHPERADSLAHAIAREKGLEKDLEEIKRLVSKAIQSSAYKRAVASGRMFREVPYTWWKSENEVSSGKMDLVFEEPDGLVIVDYKTDRVSEKDLETVPEKYRIQGQEYKQALEALSGKPVKEIIFLFLQEIFSGDTIHIS